MPTDQELTLAKFDKCSDCRRLGGKHWPSMPPNSKTAAKFRQWASSFSVSHLNIRLIHANVLL